MLPGFHGHLISQYFAEEFLDATFAGRLGEASRDAAWRVLTRWWRERAAPLGPATSVRAVFDRAALPLVTALGFEAEVGSPLSLITRGDIAQRARGPTPNAPRDGPFVATLRAAGGARCGLIVSSWGDDLDRSWREAVAQGTRIEARWCFCFNVISLRSVDTTRSYARLFLEFDLETTLGEPRTFAVFWGLLRAEAFQRLDGRERTRPLFEQVVDVSARHAAGVCASLRLGVLDAVGALLQGLIERRPAGRRAAPTAASLASAFEQSLTVVYRVLFLLFAEARSLVPVWHPVYRDSYTIEALRGMVEDPAQPRGLWEALQAISRLAHAGCRAGDLQVTPFNGRLFAPGRTPLADSRALTDEAAGRVILALSSRPGPRGAGRERIAFRDLGVEQLGAVYESVLDYEPVTAREPDTVFTVTLRSGSGRRKTSGTFYTPRSITDYLIRRTLTPLVESLPAEAILNLRVLDPAMGSAAFLVGACQFLAAAYETALVRDGECHPSDVGEPERAGFRRAIAQRCLFGVDLNPMAVQLARLSIWLATLAADRPLTFLDHHLVVGDSLVGASFDDLLRAPPGRPRSRRPPATLPLFEPIDLVETMQRILPVRVRIASEPGDSPAAVREKEAALAALAGPGESLSRWRGVADLWCACWLWEGAEPPPTSAAYAELTDVILKGRSSLPEPLARGWLQEARHTAAKSRYVHWSFEFPEVFFSREGQPLENPGFDAVLSNPPWDMIRADAGAPAEREQSRAALGRLARFAHDSGVYTAQAEGHANRYQLFVERAVALTRRGGRLGLVVPSGLAIDRSSAKLRRLLLERCDTESLIGFDNRKAVFPIHRSVRFLLLTATAGRQTSRIRCRFGEQEPARLDTLPEEEAEEAEVRATAPAAFPVTLTPRLIERLSGDDLAIPELRTSIDVAIVEKIATRFPPLAAPDGWGARFGRELNLTDDRRHLSIGGRGLHVLEGKHIEPFRVNQAGSRFRISESAAATLFGSERSFLRVRLAYRDVASPTNRLTLIAAIVPAGVVTTHTLFCLKTKLDEHDQLALCGLLNSFVANYLVRLRVSTHVTVGIIERLPVPRPSRGSSAFREMQSLARALAPGGIAGAPDHYARLQGLAARLYGLTEREFGHVLETFPLVERETREESMKAFRDLET